MYIYIERESYNYICTYRHPHAYKCTYTYIPIWSETTPFRTRFHPRFKVWVVGLGFVFLRVQVQDLGSCFKVKDQLLGSGFKPCFRLASIPQPKTRNKQKTRIRKECRKCVDIYLCGGVRLACLLVPAFLLDLCFLLFGLIVHLWHCTAVLLPASPYQSPIPYTLYQCIYKALFLSLVEYRMSSLHMLLNTLFLMSDQPRLRHEQDMKGTQ